MWIMRECVFTSLGYALSPKNPETESGLIIVRFGSRADVETADGRLIRCHIRKQLSHAVCGDRVRIQPSLQDAYVVVEIEPRSSVLGRVDDRHTVKPLAANVTDIFIVLAHRPLPSTLLIDSYLVAAEILKLQAHLLCNKADLHSKQDKQQLEALLSPYPALGYQLHWLSCVERTGLRELEKSFIDKTGVFVGQSGVGKSSIISTLLPEATIAVGALSPGIEAGAHTTTTTRLYHLPKGGNVIDSPGIREFGLWHLPKEQIMQGFREIAELSSECKFRDCTHQHEPHCHVRDALAKGAIVASRYQNYCKLFSGK